MGLDVYVMPIWKFKAGDFVSPIQSLGITTTIVGPGGIFRHESGRRPSLVARWKALRATRRLRHEIEAEIGHRVRWNDDGDVAYAKQSGGFESLRAFARWLDYRDIYPTFDPAHAGNYYNHPVMTGTPTRPLTYPQVVYHSCYSGYYLPAEIERVLYVEPHTSFGEFAFWHSVGSSQRLLGELDQLARVVNCDEHYQWIDGDPLAEVKEAFAQLYAVAKISQQSDLPIVFHG
jgi:hypothetical protein